VRKINVNSLRIAAVLAVVTALLAVAPLVGSSIAPGAYASHGNTTQTIDQNLNQEATVGDQTAGLANIGNAQVGAQVGVQVGTVCAIVGEC
jgi:hypothetical protein